MSDINDVADAIVTALNGESMSIAFTAIRKYRPEFEPQDLKTLQVTVVPKAIQSLTIARTTVQDDFDIDIGIQKKLDAADNAEIDLLVDLVQEIVRFIRLTRTFGSSFWVRSENSPVYSQEHLTEHRQFTSLVTATFRMVGV